MKKVENHYCSHKCAVRVSNAKRTAMLPIRFCAEYKCGKQIHHSKKYCSLSHAAQQRKISENQYKENIILKIKTFFDTQGRIPLKREMYGLYKEAWKLFGTWNKAIVAAGLTPNPVMFAKKYIANDGHRCDSMAEKIIDDWLFLKKIEHKRNVPYPTGKYTADFFVKNKFIEFFGLTGELKEYDINTRKKELLAEKHKLQLIKIYPQDLFPRSKLEKILEKV